MKSSTYYFHMKTEILADFHICISVPLRRNISSDSVSFFDQDITLSRTKFEKDSLIRVIEFLFISETCKSKILWFTVFFMGWNIITKKNRCNHEKFIYSLIPLRATLLNWDANIENNLLKNLASVFAYTTDSTIWLHLALTLYANNL